MKKSTENIGNTEKNNKNQEGVSTFVKKNWEDLTKQFDEKNNSLNDEISELKKEMKSLWENNSKTVGILNNEILSLKNEINKVNSEKNDFLNSKFEDILDSSQVDKVQNHVDQIFNVKILASNTLKNKLLNVARRYWWDIENLESEKYRETNRNAELHFKHTVEIYRTLYDTWTPEQKIIASDFFTQLEWVINSADMIWENLTRYRSQLHWVLWAWFLAWWAALWWLPLALVWWAIAWWVKYLWSNVQDRQKIREWIWNLWEKVPWKNNLDKTLTMIWPVWWIAKWVRNSVFKVLWVWKNVWKWGIVAWAWAVEAVWWIVWSIPLLWSVKKVTDWLSKTVWNKLFWK